jgi:hypothetical protein|tara:strand:+ start:159 stop:665 length:507 start_codon:yes stop_codon:yes gene_type:complete
MCHTRAVFFSFRHTACVRPFVTRPFFSQVRFEEDGGGAAFGGVKAAIDGIIATIGDGGAKATGTDAADSADAADDPSIANVGAALGYGGMSKEELQAMEGLRVVGRASKWDMGNGGDGVELEADQKFSMMRKQLNRKQLQTTIKPFSKEVDPEELRREMAELRQKVAL